MHRLKWFVKTPRRAIVTVVVLALVVVGAAAAAWLVSISSPTANGKFGNLSAVANTPTTFPATGCIPPASGTTACDAVIAINNTSSVPLTITGWTAGTIGNVTVSNTSGGGCSTNSVQNALAAIPAQTGLSITVPVGTTDITLPGFYTINSSLPTGCMNATFTFTGGGEVLSLGQ